MKIFLLVMLIIAGFIWLKPREELPKEFPHFVTADLRGNVVTEKIFYGKITALLLWTNSQPCLEVLADLNDVAEDLPPHCQILGLIGDKNFDAAQIENFSPIVQLKVNDDFAPILTKIKAVPTAIFVDRHGNLIEPPKLVPNAKFILRELKLLAEKDSPKFKALNSLHEKFF